MPLIGSGLVIVIAAILLIVLYPNLYKVYDIAAKHFTGKRVKKKKKENKK